MKNLSIVLFTIVLCSFVAQKRATVNVFMIGDSTMANKKPGTAPETGWGQVLGTFFTSEVKIHNHAQNGRSSKSFTDEGLWKEVIDSLKPGDYLIIQFGHNDEKPASNLHTDPQTTFKENLQRYVAEARAKGAIPILCTSLVRRHFMGTELKDTHGEYITAVRNLAPALNVPLIDMEAKTRKLVSELGPEKSKSIYLFAEPGEYATRPKGVKDSTHLQYKGALQVAALAILGRALMSWVSAL